MAKREQPASAQEEEYGRLTLAMPIHFDGGSEGKEIIIYRPRCRAMTEVLDTPRLMVQIDRFVDACCKAVNGTGLPLPFSGRDLSSVDGSELASVITAMSEDADNVLLEDVGGDGITAPLIYTLQRPVAMTRSDDGEVVHQIEFQARRVGDISEYLDARGETKEFHAFMRVFGKPLGVRIPVMTDALIDALDFLDYLVIRRQIMGKFINSAGRWKRASSLVR
jgi:hypothetical protein